MQKPLYLDDFPSFGDFDRAALTQLLGGLNTASPTIVEIGSWLGTGSTQILLDHVKSRGGRLHCVDTWQGSLGTDKHADLLARFDVYRSFLENVKNAGGADRVDTHRMASVEAADRFADDSVDLVFIDADHAFDMVRADLLAWLPKLRAGGIMCGHDCEVRVTPDIRSLLWRARNQQQMEGRAAFLDWHPGVILAVDEVFLGRARLWAETLVTLSDGRTGPATVWDIRIEKTAHQDLAP